MAVEFHRAKRVQLDRLPVRLTAELVVREFDDTIRVLPQDSNRVGFIARATTAAGYVLNNVRPETFADGLRISSLSGSLVLDVNRHGDIVTKEWWAGTEGGIFRANGIITSQKPDRPKKRRRKLEPYRPRCLMPRFPEVQDVVQRDKLPLKRVSRIVVVAVTGATQLILPADGNRVSLVFAEAAGGNYSLNNRPLATNVDGLLLNANSDKLYLDVNTHGDIVQKEWHAFGVAASSFGLIETIEKP